MGGQKNDATKLYCRIKSNWDDYVSSRMPNFPPFTGEMVPLLRLQIALFSLPSRHQEILTSRRLEDRQQRSWEKAAVAVTNTQLEDHFRP